MGMGVSDRGHFGFHGSVSSEARDRWGGVIRGGWLQGRADRRGNWGELNEGCLAAGQMHFVHLGWV